MLIAFDDDTDDEIIDHDVAVAALALTPLLWVGPDRREGRVPIASDRDIGQALRRCLLGDLERCDWTRL
jgi:hypothetical protein